MGIARDLVALEEKLRDINVNLFAPLEREELLDVSEASSLINMVTSRGFVDPIRVMQLCLQALRIQHAELRPRFVDAELVATLPAGVPGIARPTKAALQEMMKAPAREVILLGYEVTDEGMIALLTGAASRGADVIMICDRQRGSAQRLLEAWPQDLRRPRLFHDQERRGGAPYASMHAKCVLVNGNDLLVTSANFTFHGLHGNIEVGVRVSGPPAAEARKIFSHLVQSGLVTEVR